MRNLLVSFGLGMVVLILGFSSKALAQYRVAVVPFFIEQGLEHTLEKDEDRTLIQQLKSLYRELVEGKTSSSYGVDSRDFRRAVNFINNQLVRHGFEVVNYKAMDLKESEYNRLMERAVDDSALASQDVCKRYGADIAYIVWLKIKKHTTSDGKCKVEARLEGEGYDSSGHDLGVSVSKIFKITRNECDDAVIEAEKEVADKVGRVLTAYSPARRRTRQIVSTQVPAEPTQIIPEPGNIAPQKSHNLPKGALARNAAKYEDIVIVRLTGVTDFENAEVFGKILNTVRGVEEAKLFKSHISPNEPQRSSILWRLKVKGTDTFRLQANIIKDINDVLDAGGTLVKKNIKYRYTPAEVDMLKGIHPVDVTSREIDFHISRELSRDKEFSIRHDPYDDKGFD